MLGRELSLQRSKGSVVYVRQGGYAFDGGLLSLLNVVLYDKSELQREQN